MIIPTFEGVFQLIYLVLVIISKYLYEPLLKF